MVSLLAPSAWEFIVIKDQGLKNALDKAARESVLHLGINEAPVVILVCGDRRIDPLHAIEAGAAATQNMTLAATSLGLGAGWIGIGEQRRRPLFEKFSNFLRPFVSFLCFRSASQMNLQRATENPSKK